MKFQNQNDTDFHNTFKDNILDYQVDKIAYTVSKTTKFDFKIAPKSYIFVREKFGAGEQGKFIAIARQNPNITIAFVLTNPNEIMGRAMTMTTSDWCDRYGFKWFEVTDTKSIRQYMDQYRSFL